MNCTAASPEACRVSMRLMCRSPVIAPDSPIENTTSETSLWPARRASAKPWVTLATWPRLTNGISETSGRSRSPGWNMRWALALPWITMSCSSITISARGTLAKSASNRSDAPSAAALL